jgi:tetratricopeptide (TPR) repeat protein
MRKGRSQRKARGSLPPLSTRTQPRVGDGAQGPQVTIGLTGPRSEPGDVETRSEAGDVSVKPSPSARLETRSAYVPDVNLEIVREAERLEGVREKSLEIVRESLELVRESLEQDEQDEAPVAAQPPEVAPNEPSVALAERTQEPVALALTPHVGALPTPEEMSIPPVGDLAVEPIAERFFSEGEIAVTHGATDDDDEWDQANKLARKSRPEVVQRRARFAKYVRWAVGGAAVVCLAALARTTMTPAKHASLPDAPRGAAVAALVATEAAPAAAAPAPEPKAATAAVVQEPAAAAEAVQAPVQEKVDAPKVDVPAAEAPAAAPAVVTGDKTALQEKNDARRALERSKLGDAIAAGERSVALDPTDGEAWLLLGAAYQEKGAIGEARRCYNACLKEGKRGPVGECRAMLR